MAPSCASTTSRRQLASPFPLLSAIAARTSRIEIGTAVIDMRYENPLYMAEEAAAADLISAGRMQLGISRGSPEPALRGSEAFGYVPCRGDHRRRHGPRHTRLFRAAIAGAGVVPADVRMTGSAGMLPIQPQSPGLPDRIWWGSGTRQTAVWTAEQGMNLMSSTLLVEDTGVPFDELQAEQIQWFRQAWAEAGWERTPRVSVSRSVLPIVTDEDRRYFGGRAGLPGEDQVGVLEGVLARFGRSYTGEPDVIAQELSADAAVREADTFFSPCPTSSASSTTPRCSRPSRGTSRRRSGGSPRSRREPAGASGAHVDGVDVGRDDRHHDAAVAGSVVHLEVGRRTWRPPSAANA